jgi:ubiquinone/menaquinone biosynthesis C-methylase UbiE
LLGFGEFSPVPSSHLNVDVDPVYEDGQYVGEVASMNTPEIERIRQVYAVYERDGRWNNPSPGGKRALAEQYEALRRLLEEKFSRPLSECKILDIGCGGGELLSWLCEQGARPDNLVGVDLLPDSVERARRKYPAITFLEANAEKLDFPDASFDVISVQTVFSSILDEATSKNIAQTITRILKKDGVVAWYDMRYPNPSNRNVRAMTKARIGHLFPKFLLDLQSIELLPPIAARLGQYTRILYPVLMKIPVLRSHYVGLLKRRESILQCIVTLLLAPPVCL